MEEPDCDKSNCPLTKPNDQDNSSSVVGSVESTVILEKVSPGPKRSSIGRGRGRGRGRGEATRGRPKPGANKTTETGNLQSPYACPWTTDSARAEIQPSPQSYLQGHLAEHVELDSSGYQVEKDDKLTELMQQGMAHLSVVSQESTSPSIQRGAVKSEFKETSPAQSKIGQIGILTSSPSVLTKFETRSIPSGAYINDEGKGMPPLEQISVVDNLGGPTSSLICADGSPTLPLPQPIATSTVGDLQEADCAVLVFASLPETVSRDGLEGYCQNLGDEVEVVSVTMLGGQKARVELLGLTSEEVSKVQTKTHKIKRSEISVHIETKTFPSASFTLDDEETDDKQSTSDSEERTIEVKKFTPNITCDMLEMYFDSARSGGCKDSVQEVKIVSPGVAHVTFHKPEVAARVLARDSHKWSLQLQYMSESIQKAHEMNRLFLKKIPAGMDEGYLQLVLESQLEIELEESNITLLGDVAVVTFTKVYTVSELEKMISRIRDEPVKGSTIQAELYKVCSSIRLSNVTKTTHYEENFVRLYFKSGKSGGGVKNVKNVEMLGNGEAVVFFESPEDAQCVLKSTHTKTFGQGVKLELNDQLCVYRQQGKDTSVAEPESPKANSASAKPNQVSSSTKIAPLKVQVKPIIAMCLKQDPTGLNKHLGSVHVELDFETKTGIVTATPTTSTAMGWEKECRKLVDSYVKDQYAVLENVAVPKEALPDLAAQLSNLRSERASFTHTFGKNNRLSVAGPLDVVKYAESIIKEISDQYTVTKVAISLNQKEFEFMTKIKLPRMKGNLPNVTITPDTNKHALQVQGTIKLVKEFQPMVEELKVHAEIPVQLFQPIVSYLTQRGYQNLLTFIKKESYPLAVHSSPGTGISFLCDTTDAKFAEVALEKLKKSVVLSTDTVPDSFLSLQAQLEDFRPLCKELEMQNTVDISIDRKNLTIVGFQEGVHQCKTHLLHYIKEKCTVEVTVDIECGMWRLFQSYMKEHWHTIVEKCKKLQVVYQEPSDEDDSLLSLKGDKLNVEAISQDVAKLKTTVIQRSLEKDQPGTCKFFRSDKARMCLDGIEAKQKVAIEITEAEEEESVGFIAATAPSGKFKKKCTANVPNSSKRIAIYIGDITEFDKADVIVNAANEDLKHIGGVAKAIADKGGQIIQDDSNAHVKKRGKVDTGDVWMTERVGNLSCKGLVHAVGPRWSGHSKDKDEALLRKVCMRSLKVSGRFRSISFPAISSGVYGFPIDSCAETIVKAFVDFSEQQSATEMREINIVLFKESDSAPFVSALQKVLPPANVHVEQTSYANRSPYPRQQPLSASSHFEGQPTHSASTGRRKKGRTGSTLSAGTDRIKLHRAGLLDVQADAYVNSTNSNLDLSHGAIAQALLKAGGKILQDECTKKAPINTGGVAITGPGNLACQYVLHTVIPQFKRAGGSAEKVFRKSIRTCLEKCSTLKVTSIAFPSIGTGNLGFPSDIVAKIMVGEVCSFFASHNFTSITTVHFVIFMADTHKAFQKELQSGSPSNPAESSFAAHGLGSPTLKQQPRRVGRQKGEQSAASRGPSDTSTFTVGQFSVSVVQGDIAEECSDAIVVPTNSTMHLVGQGVAGAILKKGGPELQVVCDSVVANGSKPTEGRVIITSVTGSLKSKSLFHIVFESQDDRKFIKVITNCLQEAEKMKYRSISFPAIGTGIHSYQPQVAALGMLKAIKHFQQKLNHLKDVRIVLFPADVFATFLATFQNPGAADTPGFFERTINFIGSFLSSGPSSAESASESMYGNFPVEGDGMNQEVVIRIYGKTKQSVDSAESEIDKLIDDTFTKEMVENEYVGHLTDQQKQTLHTRARELCVKIEIDMAPLNTIQIKGDETSVHKMNSTVVEVLAEAELAANMKQEAERLYKTIRWSRTDSNNCEEEYTLEENHAIETAYHKGNGKRRFEYGSRSHHTHFTIDFDQKEETDHNSGNSVCKVERIDLMKKVHEDVPNHWDKMPLDPVTVKEIPVHIVDLDSKSQEFAEVKRKFDATMQPNSASPKPGSLQAQVAGLRYSQSSQYNKVVKVERIQNPTLYFQYLARKKEMDKLNPQGHQNERELFHGTKPAICPQINHGGFNRSYCGQNATVYGKGVYFARGAEYSARSTYSPPDAKGYKYIYLAKVLTGEFTNGGSGMLVAPPKDPSKNSHILFDSVVDSVATPGIFVVFQDAQNYPEYLITFN